MDFVGAARPRSPDGVAHAAALVGCEPAALAAVIQVEAAGAGFDRSRRPKCLFEPHVFHRLLSPPERARAIAAGLAYPRWGEQPYPRDSYPRLLAALALDRRAALESCSWGLAQILGGNHRAAGYPDAEAMVEAFKAGEDEQLLAMARFIAAHPAMRAAPCRRDWAAFARANTGPGYARHAYDARLRAAYARA